MRTFNFILFHRFIYFTIIYFFSVITIMSISNRTLQINFPNISAKKILLIIVINLFLGMLTLIVHAIMIFHYRYKLPIFIISLNLISLLTYFFIIIYSLSKNLLSVSNTIQKNITQLQVYELINACYDMLKNEGILEKNYEMLEAHFIKYIIWLFLFSTKRLDYKTISKEYDKLFTWLENHFPTYKKNKIIRICKPRSELLSVRMIVVFMKIANKAKFGKFAIYLYSKI